MSKKTRLDELGLLKDFIASQAMDAGRIVEDETPTDAAARAGKLIMLASFIAYQKTRQDFVTHVSIETLGD